MTANLPSEFFRVHRKGGTARPYNQRFGSVYSKGNQGGTLRTIKAARERKQSIQAMYHDAVVTIYRAEVVWEEVE